MAKILNLVAAELWLRQDEANFQNTITRVARSMTIRLAEHLAQYITGLMWQASSLATPHTHSAFCTPPTGLNRFCRSH